MAVGDTSTIFGLRKRSRQEIGPWESSAFGRYLGPFDGILSRERMMLGKRSQGLGIWDKKTRRKVGRRV